MVVCASVNYRFLFHSTVKSHHLNSMIDYRITFKRFETLLSKYPIKRATIKRIQQHRAQIFRIFDLNDLKGTLGNLL